MSSIQTRKQVRKPVVACLLAVILLFGTVGLASAHPLGNFTINRYARIQADAHRLSVTYIIDMAEIPAHAERAGIDVDGNGELSGMEVERYRQAKVAALSAGLQITAAGEPLPLRVLDSALTFPFGQAGLPTLRLVMTLAAALPQGAQLDVHYRDSNYADRIGWQEVLVTSAAGTSVLDSTAPATDASHELTAYPQDLLSAPLQVREATFTVGAAQVERPDTAALQAQGRARTLLTPAVAGRPTDPFAELVAIPELGWGAVLLAVLAATGWGAVHAVSPGHGKTIVAAYLVGSRGTARHALFLGLTTTITHTAGVFALGFVTLALSRFILPEQLYPWLNALSGSLVVLIGLSLVRARLLGGSHAAPPVHGAGHAGAAARLAAPKRRPVLSRRLAVIPAQAVTTHDYQSHEHGHEHSHEHGHEHSRHHAHHRHGHAHGHQHGPGGHSHLPPGANGQPVTWRSLLALGISGGLLPCPSALVLMLAAISLNRIGFGLVLILAFSLGLAGVLTLIGIVLVHSRKVLRYVPEGGRIAHYAPVASAIFITGAGLLITVEALARTGLLQI